MSYLGGIQQQRGQLLYPERGQKQTFFDPSPTPHLVHVVIEWPLNEYVAKYEVLKICRPYFLSRGNPSRVLEGTADNTVKA